MANFVVVLLLFLFASCSASAEPQGETGLPFGVFPLNDVRWVERSIYGDWLEEEIYDTNTGELIALTQKRYTDITTRFVKRIGENKAELYSSIERTVKTDVLWEVEEGKLKFNDTTFTIEPDLTGWIYLENRKVYFQGLNSWDEKTLLLDFGLNIGDTFMFPGDTYPGFEPYNRFYLISIDNVFVGNEYRKRHNFANKKDQAHSNFSLIEGIGCNIHFFYTLTDFGIAVDLVHNIRLLSVYFKDKKIWGN
jgi:hypothetical protein